MNINIELGFIFGIIGMVFFSLYGVPKKFVASSQLVFMVNMGIGVAVISTLIGFLFAPISAISPFRLIIAYSAGAIWYFATLLWVKAIDFIGLSRSISIKSVNAVFSTLYGIFLFQEYSWAEPFSFMMVIIGCIMVVLAIVILSKVGNSNNQQVTNLNFLMLGGFFSLCAGLGHASYCIPWRLILRKPNWSWDFYMFCGQGILFSAIVTNFCYSPIKKIQEYCRISLRDKMLGIISGVFVGLGIACMILSMNKVGVVVGMLLVNLNIVLAVPIGLYIFKETDLKKEKSNAIIGLIIAALGMILLAVSKI